MLSKASQLRISVFENYIHKRNFKASEQKDNGFKPKQKTQSLFLRIEFF